MKIHKVAIYLSAVLLLVASYCTSLEHSGRYLKYLISPLIGLSFLFNRKFVVKRFILNNFILFLGLSLCNFFVLLYKNQINTRFFEEVFLLLIPILTVMLITGIKNGDIGKTIDLYFKTYCLSFVAFFWKDLLDLGNLLSSFRSALTLSEFPTESWLAFPLGVFSLYYFFEKRKWYFLISFFFFLLAFKRIAILGFIVVIIGYWVYFKLLKQKFKPIVTLKSLVILNTVFISVIYLLVSNFFTTFVKTHTGITINHFTQGRFVVYKDVINQFATDIWTGSTLGSTHLYLRNKYEDYQYLHSDILKIMLELGVFLFIIWLILFIAINIKGKKSILLILFLNILFISDNVFIYFDTLFVFYLIISKYDNDISQKTIE